MEEAAQRRPAGFPRRYDLWLTPVPADPPAALGELVAPGPYDQVVERLWAYAPFTRLGNPTGLPAMSVPLAWNQRGLPLGCRFMGRFGEEATLIRLAAQLEAARPCAHRRPPVG